MNRNKKGFTLVELIVVMCLMGIIMAAVMALLAPTSKYYYKVQTTKDQENCALSVGKAINNELQYALAVEVYSSDTASVSPTDPSKFTNYIKIDNVTARSSSKKHATGIVYKGTTATHSESVVMGEATYDENAFKITLSEYNNQKGNNFIMLDFESNPMKYEGGSYVKNTDVKYNSSLSVNFSNINSSLTMGVSRADSISVSYDASKTDYIFIYYQPAQNGATATTTTTSLTTTTTTTPTTTTASDDSGSTTTTTTTTSESSTTSTTTSESTTTTTKSDDTTPSDNQLVIHYIYTTQQYSSVHIQVLNGSNIMNPYTGNNSSTDITVEFTGSDTICIWPKFDGRDVSYPGDSTPNIYTNYSTDSPYWNSYYVRASDVSGGLHELWIKDGVVYVSNPG